MKTYLYLTTAVAGMMIGGNVWAQCVTTQDCTALGYSETSCPNGKGVKCPFGNKWFCASTEITPEQCTELGFTQPCTGTGYSGGSGAACGGKYYECTCASGYIWNDSSQKCEDATANCVIGALYYADGTCSNDYIYTKKLLGIVIYEKSASQNGWVMTHKPVATGIYWSTEYVDISGLTNITSESKLTDIQASCTNTDKITAQGNSSKYPAAWAAKNYKEGGKTWCLPSGGLLKNALDNSANFTKFNAAVYKIQASAGTSAATILGNVYKSGSYYYERVWSSSEYDNLYAWSFNAYTSGSFGMDGRNKYDYSNGKAVRPVLAF